MPSDIVHSCDDLIYLFNDTFSRQFNTRLVRGDNEPIYLPANGQTPYHQILFAHGFFSSALHEIAHWCIAGEARRRQTDYGYWYAPDGRNRSQQEEFERVEVKPQALEWLFSKACGKSFRVSVDNLSGESTDATAFKRAVLDQAKCYCNQSLPVRAERFYRRLCLFYNQSDTLSPNAFALTDC